MLQPQKRNDVPRLRHSSIRWNCGRASEPTWRKPTFGCSCRSAAFGSDLQEDVSMPPAHGSAFHRNRSVIATSLRERHGRLYAGVDERSPCDLGRLKARQRGTAISDGTMEAPSMIRPLVFEEVQGVVRTAESSFYAILESYREGYAPGDLLHWNLPKCPTTQPAKKRVGSVIRGRISKEMEMQPHLSETCAYRPKNTAATR